jgi:hypothetical protein
MLEKPTFRLILGIGLPIASALVMQQFPKTGVAEVPFAFQVQEQTLPPGFYLVRQADRGRSVRIQREKAAGPALKCVAVKGKFGKAHEARLAFENHKGHYVLSEVWFDAEGRGLVLREGQARREDLAKQSAQPNQNGLETRYIRFR